MFDLCSDPPDGSFCLVVTGVSTSIASTAERAQPLGITKSWHFHITSYTVIYLILVTLPHYPWAILYREKWPQVWRGGERCVSTPCLSKHGLIIPPEIIMSMILWLQWSKWSIQYQKKCFVSVLSERYITTLRSNWGGGEGAINASYNFVNISARCQYQHITVVVTSCHTLSDELIVLPLIVGCDRVCLRMYV